MVLIKIKNILILSSFLALSTLLISCEEKEHVVIPDIPDPIDTAVVIVPRDPDSNMVRCRIFSFSDTSQGVMQARKNRGDFIGDLTCYKVSENGNDYYKLYIYTYLSRSGNYNTEYMRLKLNRTTEKQALNILNHLEPPPSADYSVEEHDYTLDHYTLDTTQSNFAEITRLDTINNIIEGKFWMQFRITGQLRNSDNNPWVVRFSAGSFKAIIK